MVGMRELTIEEMSKELLEAGWLCWEQVLTIWQSPYGSVMVGVRPAWEIMARERAKRLDS
jgi:hypothetical protein